MWLVARQNVTILYVVAVTHGLVLAVEVDQGPAAATRAVAVVVAAGAEARAAARAEARAEARAAVQQHHVPGLAQKAEVWASHAPEARVHPPPRRMTKKRTGMNLSLKGRRTEGHNDCCGSNFDGYSVLKEMALAVNAFDRGKCLLSWMLVPVALCGKVFKSGGKHLPVIYSTKFPQECKYGFYWARHFECCISVLNFTFVCKSFSLPVMVM